MSYKLYVLDYPLKGLMPVVSYQVELAMQLEGYGEDINVRTFLPRTDSRQRILSELNASGQFVLDQQTDGLNRLAAWKADAVEGQQNIRYVYQIQTKQLRYELPVGSLIPDKYPSKLSSYLQAEDGIQVDDPLIAQELTNILPQGELYIADVLARIHRHLQDKFENRNFSGFTDALTALKLGEASCNGKSRLFVAMARKMNIPARLVGGFIMDTGSKRTSHQWVEAYVNGFWVPFDTINDHFAEIPANYLTLYYGDESLFTHSKNINFQYAFTTSKKMVPRGDAQEALDGSALNVLNLYSMFERVGISLDLLKVLLMIPIGALVTVVFRNVIGLETFGTFLPALIAAAARETGLLWGLIGFVLIILITAVIRKGLDWLQLLHSPKMAVILAVVVWVMMSMTVTGVHFGLFELAQMTLFPIAILAITAERFSIMVEEDGYIKSLKIMLMTLLVIAAAYAVMSSLFLQALFLAFPELLFVVMALNIWLGKWVGMRLMEFYRFRHLIFAGKR
ncbi:MAG: UUP1 family membrane protein [Gammaproteobacteria bacterium]|nr:UUP1 family membrane protein [Gammaproteobacteria bacterium]